MGGQGRRFCRSQFAAILILCASTTVALSANDPQESDAFSPGRTAANQSVGIEEPPVKELPKVAAELAAEIETMPEVSTPVMAEPGLLLPPRGERRLRPSEKGAPAPGIRANPAGLSGLWPLLVVTALIGAVYVGVKRYRGGALVSAPGAMRVLGRLQLSPRHQVALVQVGQRVLVVGISAGEMRTLHIVDDAEEAALLAARSGNSRGDAAFTDWLGREGRQFEEASEEASEQPVRRGPSGVSELLRKVRTMQT